MKDSEEYANVCSLFIRKRRRADGRADRQTDRRTQCIEVHTGWRQWVWEH